jgi:hypothetical protein
MLKSNYCSSLKQVVVAVVGLEVWAVLEPTQSWQQYLQLRLPLENDVPILVPVEYFDSIDDIS